MDSCNSKNSKSHKKLKNSINSNFYLNTLTKIDPTTLNISIHSSLDNLNKIDFHSFNSNMYSALDSLNKINFHSFNYSMHSALDSLNKINFHSFNYSMHSALDSLNKINFHSFNKKLSSAFRILDDSKLNSWYTQIFDNITIDSCNNIINNVNAIIPNISLENLEITQKDIDEDNKSYESTNFITKILTGTISFDDIKNKKIATILILFIIWLLVNLSSYLLQDSYEYVKNYLKNHFFPEKEILTIEDYNNYRIIVADILNIRQQPSTKSTIIGKLYYLNVVKIIDEKPYWIKIEYKDLENDIYLSGWVCKKYTKNFSDETKNLINLNSNQNN